MSPEQCPKCKGSNIVLKNWKGYKRSKPSSSSLNPFDSRSSIEKNFSSGFEKAITFAGLLPEEVFEIITQVEALETGSKYKLPEMVFTDKAYGRGFTEGLISLIDESKPH